MNFNYVQYSVVVPRIYTRSDLHDTSHPTVSRVQYHSIKSDS